jgi:hypothetical protein
MQLNLNKNIKQINKFHQKIIQPELNEIRSLLKKMNKLTSFLKNNKKK